MWERVYRWGGQNVKYKIALILLSSGTVHAYYTPTGSPSPAHGFHRTFVVHESAQRIHSYRLCSIGAKSDKIGI